MRTLAWSRTGEVIYNESAEHASIVIETLFASAKAQVDILSGNLSPSVYVRDPVIREARRFLLASSRSTVRIIVEEDLHGIGNAHPFLTALRGLGTVKLKIADESIKKLYGCHFVVTDNDNYRFESDKSKPAAIACFGHERGASNLRSVYSDIWERCREVPVYSE